MGTRNNAEHINSLPESHPRPTREGLRALGGAHGTFRSEWQCDQRGRRAQGASGSALGAPRAEWKCGSHCHSAVNVRGGTPRGEWQCDSVRWGPSGSAIGAVGAPRGRVAVRLTLPLGIERTESARPRGEWQCAWYAQGRVEVWFTLPLGGERTGRNAQGRVAVRLARPRGEWQWGWCLGASFGPVGAASASRRSSELTGDDPFAKKNLSLQAGAPYLSAARGHCGQGTPLRTGGLVAGREPSRLVKPPVPRRISAGTVPDMVSVRPLHHMSA